MQLAANVNAVGTAFLALRGLLATFPCCGSCCCIGPSRCEGIQRLSVRRRFLQLCNAVLPIMQRVFKAFQGALFSRVPPSTSSSLPTWRSPSRVTSWNNRRNLQVLLSKSQCMDRRDCGCGNSTRLSSLSATIVDIKFRPKVSFRHYFPLLAVARAR